MSYTENARRLRPYIVKAAQSLADEDAINAVELFEPWVVGVKYVAQESRVSDLGKLYRCKQSHTSQADWQPHLTPALWDLVVVGHSGTIDDPIPADIGLTYVKDKYYIEEDSGKVYLCIRQDTPEGTTLYYMPHDLVGIYFEEVTNN